MDVSTNQPLVSLVLFAYNHEHYIREAIDAAFSQTYSPLEIIISDDCSTDHTFRVIEEMTADYQGPHAIVIRMNDHNLGLAAHINQVMTLVRGDLVVVAAGDDVSLPDRVSIVTHHWLKDGRKSGSIFSRYRAMSESGKITAINDTANKKTVNLIDRNLPEMRSIIVGTLGCAHAWTRDVFDFFGPLNERIIHEDITIPLRSLLIGSVTFLPDELVMYRLTANSLSRASFKTHRERFRKMARYWEGRVANYRQYALDSAKVAIYNNVCSDDLAFLELVLKPYADLALFNFRFFSGDLSMQIRTIFDFSMTVSPLRRLKLLSLSLFPFLYRFRLKS